MTAVRIDQRARFHKALGITTDVTGAGEFAWYFLICGPCCIGKSTFIRDTCFHRSNPLDTVDNNLITETFFKNNASVCSTTRHAPGLPTYDPERGFIREKFHGLSGHHEVAVNSDPKHWPSGWFSEDYIIKKGAIILGVPLEEWLKRIHKRKRHLAMKRLPKVTKLEAIYTRWLTVLNNNNIPYIFVDNRNDYPILDESSFFTMIKD